MHHILDVRADRIEMVLASHRIDARVRGGRVTPTSVYFEVLAPLGTRVNKVAALHEELALALGAPDVTVRRRRDVIEIIVPRSHRKPIFLERLLRRMRGKEKVPRVTTLLGLDDEGDPLLLRLSSPDVGHVLVAGTTGSGKTMLLRVMVLTLGLWNCQRHVQLVLIDPKARGLAPLASLPHVWGPLCTRIEDILAMLDALIVLMERRDHEGTSWPHMVVFIDELAEVLTLGGEMAREMLTRLVQRGREAGIHIVAATQKPTARVLGSLMKGNFPVRIVGRVASADDARVATGIPGSGAEKLHGQGEFLTVAQGRVIPFLAPYLDREALARLVATAKGSSARALAAAERSGLATNAPSRAQSTRIPDLSGGITSRPATFWARKSAQRASDKARGMGQGARRNTDGLVAQMLAEWVKQGKPLSLTATLRALGRTPGGALWDTYSTAYTEALARWGKETEKTWHNCGKGAEQSCQEVAP